MPDISPISIELAQLQGHALYELAISTWGNRGAGADPTSSGFSFGDRISLVGAEVHPRSDIEGFRIRWSPRPVQQPSIIVAPDTIVVNDFFVMRDKPFRGRLQGPILIAPLPQDFYGDLYLPTQGAAQTFGGAMVFPTIFDAPELWAMLWIKNEPRDSGARHHYRTDPTMTTTRALTGFGTVDTICALPMAGRKNIRVLLQSTTVPASPGSAAAPINVQISGLAGNNTGVGIGLANRLQEYVIADVHVAAGNIVMYPVPYTPHQWLLIKAEVEEPVPGGISWRVDASDYP